MLSMHGVIWRALVPVIASVSLLLGSLALATPSPSPLPSPSVSPSPATVPTAPMPPPTVDPSTVSVATSDRVLRFTIAGRGVSTATLCPGYTFDQFGVTGPTFSPDFHWVLVDILGPFQPGNVARNHALIEVATGGIVRSAEFPEYMGFPSTLDTLSWASGERQTLHYASGTNHVLRERTLRAIPPSTCRA